MLAGGCEQVGGAGSERAGRWPAGLVRVESGDGGYTGRGACRIAPSRTAKSFVAAEANRAREMECLQKRRTARALCAGIH